MDFSEYQNRSADTAIYPGRGGEVGLLYVSLGLANEAGEVGGKIKKAMRDDNLMHYGLSNQRASEVMAEVGDVLWYLAQVATEAGFTLEDAAQANLDKLADRNARGVLQGSGDKR